MVALMSDVIIERTDNFTIVTVFDAGFSITVNTAGQGLLDITGAIPRNQSLEGITRGLLGNNNEDETDDLIYPNGTAISSNSSDRIIHDFGQSCKFRGSQLI